MASKGIELSLSGKFDYKEVIEGIKEIKKQISSIHLGDDIAKELQSSLEKIDLKLPKIQNLLNKDELGEKDLEKLQKLIQGIGKDIASFNELVSKTDFTKAFSSIDLGKIENLDKQIKSIQDRVQVARQELIDTFTKESKIDVKNNVVQEAITSLFSVEPSQVKTKFQEIQATIESQLQETEDKIRNLTDSDISSGPKIIQALFGDDSTVTIVKGKVTEFKTQLGELVQQFKELTPGTEEAKNKLSEIFTLINTYTKNKNNEKIFQGPSPEDLNAVSQLKDNLERIEELSKTKEEFFNENEAEKVRILEERVKFLEDRLKELEKLQPNLISGAKDLTDKFDSLGNEIEEDAEKAHKLKTQQDALNATFGGLAHRIESAISAMAIFNKSMQIVRNAIKSVKDLDAAFTQIAIVSEQSGEQAWKLFDDFNKLAKQYSITTKDLTEGAKLFYQQGLNSADTMKMVEASTVSAALGEVTMTEAANTLTAAIQGYNESAAVAMDYTDKIAMVGAVSAADFNELSTAMEKTASSAYTAGIDFDHLLGYLGKMIEVTREAPANLGTAMKTIIARFEDMKKDPMAILEDGVSANKVEAALATIGIALRDSEGEFRALQDVIDELGMKWESLTRNQQAYIATVAAGSRQQSRFLAMMNNYDRTLDLIAESQNSAGAAAKQYATYQDSIAAAQARLTASWEKLYSKIVDNDIIKFVINSLSELLELLSKIPPSITAIGATVGALGLQNVINNNGGIIGILSKLLSGGMNKDAEKAGGNIMLSLVKGMTGSTKALIDLAKESGKSFSEMWYEIYGKNIIDNITRKTKNLGNAFKEIGPKIKEGFSGLKQIILDPKVLGILAVTAAITAMIIAIEKAKHRAEEAAKKVQELNEKTLELEEELKTKKDLLSSYDELNKKVNRTKEEQKELNDIIKNIKDNYSDALVYMDAYGNMQLENRKALDKTTESIKNQINENKKLTREGQKNLLQNTPRGQWTEEILTSAGIPAETAKQLLESRNDFKTPLDISSIRSLRNNGVYDEQEAISQLEKIAKEYDIYDGLSEYFEQTSIKGVGGKTIRTYTKTFEEIAKVIDDIISKSTVTTTSLVDKYIYSLDVDQYFDDLKITDPKYSGPVMYLRQLMYEMDPSNFKNNKEDISEFIKSLLTIDDPSKIVNITENLRKFFNGELTNANDLNKALKDSGINLGENFINGFLEGVAKNKEQVRQNTIKVIEESLKVKVTNPEKFYNQYDITQLQNRSDLATMIGARGYTGKEAFDMVQQIAPYADQLNNAIETAFEEGSINEINNTINSITTALETSKLSDTVKNIILELIGDAARSGEELINKIFDDAQTEIQQFSNDYKKAMDDVSSGKNVKLSDTDLTSSDAGVYVDPESGELMVSIITTLEQLEEERLQTIETIKKAYQDVNEEYQGLEDKGDKLTAEEKERKKQLERQLSILNQQMTLVKNMGLNGQEASWGKSIQLAKDYQSNLQTIKNIQESIKKQGFLDVSDMESILELMPQYVQYFEKVGDSIIQTEGNIYTISEQNIENMMQAEKEKYDYKLALERQQAEIAYDQAVKEYQTLVDTYGKEIGYSNTKTDALIADVETQFQNEKKATDDTIRAYEQGAIAELDVEDQKTEQMVILFRDALQQMAVDYESFISGLENGKMPDFSEAFSGLSAQVVKSRYSVDIDFEKIDEKGSKEREALIKAMIDDAAAKVQSAWDRLQSLQSVDVPQLENLKKQLEGSGAAAKELEKAAEAAAKAIEDITKAGKDLDDLLIEIKRDLKDITVDYNPFTDLFEAWEHEWDYYYNIKNLLAQLEQQGQWIDNVISSDYASAEEKMDAYRAKIGNIMADISANDAYILTLRQGIAQNARELEEKFGQYYNVDNVMGSWQVYQKDTNLHEWEDVANAARKVSYELSKIINQQENELSLLESTQEALEQERSAYESILSTVDGVIDSLKDNEDITVDLSGLTKVKGELELALKDESVEEIKAKTKELNQEIQALGWKLDLNDNIVVGGIDDSLDDMEDLKGSIEEFIESLNEAITKQQEKLQELTEYYIDFRDTAISTQEELYNAIVENYQNEINQKKKQYDYLKQLDNDYLNTIKNNINKERQAREDANKQKSYQQNLQRAQLLQMDTSGAYRGELANLNKEIESQRQELYDDLVDKQVEALETEIEKRHELYDMEVAALEERLAYMQENAILLWEMVNEIVANGSDAMMATLENTTEYINSNELAKERQRKTWELSVQKTFAGVVEGEIDSIKLKINAVNEEIKNIQELKAALELNTDTYVQSTTILEEKNGDFQEVMSNYMQVWTDMTSDMTGYHKNWKDTVKRIQEAMDADIAALKALGESGGGIYQINDKLKQTAEEMYDSFITERQNYANQLEGFVRDIELQIGAAISQAANNLTQAANSIQINPVSSDTGGGGGGYGTPAPGNDTPTPNKTYKVRAFGTLSDSVTGSQKYVENKFTGSSQEAANKAARDWLNSQVEAFTRELKEKYRLDPDTKGKSPKVFWIRTPNLVPYKKGGLANFTGPAWLDGTKSEPERILSPRQTKLFESMVSSLEQASNNSNINSPLGSSYNIGDINTSIQVAKLDDNTDIEKLVKKVEDKIVKTIRNKVVVSM